MINIAKPSIGEKEWKSLKEPIDNFWITQGEKVKEFENIFSKIHKVKHAVAVNSCTSALHLILIALGIIETQTMTSPHQNSKCWFTCRS